MPEYIIGLDPGLTNTGLVVIDYHGNIESQTLIQVSSTAGKRLYEIERAVDMVLNDLDYFTIFLEGYAYNARYQRESLAELGGVLRRYFYVRNFLYWVIPPLLLKKFVTGTAKANKNFMKKSTKERWGLAFKSDDVCDAYGLARLGLEVVKYPDNENLELYQRQVVGDIANNVGWYLEPNTANRKHGKRKNNTQK